MMKYLIISTYFLQVLGGCTQNRENKAEVNYATGVVQVDRINRLNEDIKPEVPTVDICIYYPETTDSLMAINIPLEKLLYQFEFAKKVYGSVGVQLNLLFVKTFNLSPGQLGIFATQPTGDPAEDPELNQYLKWRIEKEAIHPDTEKFFKSIIGTHPENPGRIHIVAGKEITTSFYARDEENQWVIDTVSFSKGAISFSPFSLEDRIPRDLRGSIFISGIPGDLDKLLAHELGHILINVTHEYRDKDYNYEGPVEGGLLVSGEEYDIPSGIDGRWHLERLLMSPFIYRLDEDNNKIWNDDFIENGHYFDPIYDGKFVD